MEYYDVLRQDVEDIEELQYVNSEYGGGDPTWSESGDYEDSNEYFDKVILDITKRDGEEPLSLFRVNKLGEMYGVLEQWFEHKGWDMEEVVRGFYEDNNYIYFVSGYGYNLFDDLFGGNGDGSVEKEFARFANGEE